MLWKYCTQYASKFGKLSSGHGTGKGVFIPIPKKGNAKECSNYHTIALISHASEVMLKNSSSPASTVLEPWTPRCSSWIWKRQRNKRSNCKQLLDHRKSKRIKNKTSTSASLTTLEPLTVWITTNCGKFFKRWEYQTTLPASWETCMQVKKPQLEQDMNNRLVPNKKRSTSRLYIVSLLI